MDLITQGCFMVAGRVMVTGLVTGTSSLSVPAGVTSITFTGQGGVGVYNNPKFVGSDGVTAVTAVSTGTASTVGPTVGVSGGALFSGSFGIGTITSVSSAYITLDPISQQASRSSLSFNTTPDSTINLIATTVAFSGGSSVGGFSANWTIYQNNSSGSASFGVALTTNITRIAAYYTAGTSTTASSAQSTNGTKTWASYAAAGSPAAYQQTMTLTGAAATISYSVASGTTLYYEYTL